MHLERFRLVPKKISLGKGRNHFIPTFTRTLYALLLQKTLAAVLTRERNRELACVISRASKLSH
jgi:hypothetical protein